MNRTLTLGISILFVSTVPCLSGAAQQSGLTVQLKKLGEASVEDEKYIGALITVSASQHWNGKIAKTTTFATGQDGKKLPIVYVHGVSWHRTSGTVSGPAEMSGISFKLDDKTYKCFSPFGTLAVKLLDDESALSLSLEKDSKLELALLFQPTSSPVKSVTVFARELRAKAEASLEEEDTRRPAAEDIPQAVDVAVAGGNLQRTWFYASRSIRESKGLKWKFATKAEIDSSPVVSGETVYVGSLDNCLYALKVATGELKWRFPTQDSDGLKFGQ